jgi:hypothetical protein
MRTFLLPLRYRAGAQPPAEIDAAERARRAGLVVISADVAGTNCGNCEHFVVGACNHPAVNQPVSERWCCNYWWRPGAVWVAGVPPAPQQYVRTPPVRYGTPRGAAVAERVREQLDEDYAPAAVKWVDAAVWSGPTAVELDRIDYSNENDWRASREPEKVAKFAKKIRRGKMKPIILVLKPGNTKYTIIDGHHRALAYRKLGIPVMAYCGEVPRDAGPWDEMHASQRQPVTQYAKDAAGHEHKGKGPGGGQFTGDGSGSGPKDAVAPQKADSSSAKTVLSDALKRDTSGATESPADLPPEIWGSLPAPAQQRLQSRLSGGVKSGTVAEVTDQWYAAEPDVPAAKRRPVMGFYDPQTGGLHLATDAVVDPRGVAAHEIGHALDVSDDRGTFDLSGDPEWIAAWRAEMGAGQLSNYARTDEVEGFAEFARHLWGAGAADTSAFPKCAAYFRRVGLTE